MTIFNDSINAMAGDKASIDSHIETMLGIRGVTSLPTKVDKMINILNASYPEVQEHYYELHGVNKCYKEGD
jgi:hypothetical protein